MDLFSGRFIVYSCHKGSNQFLAFAKSGQIVTVLAEMCVGVTTDRDAPIIVDCDNNQKSQLWQYNDEVVGIGCDNFSRSECSFSKFIFFLLKQDKLISHVESGLCLQNNRSTVILGACNSTDVRFKWKLKSNV